jgi:hypothetical protein
MQPVRLARHASGQPACGAYETSHEQRLHLDQLGSGGIMCYNCCVDMYVPPDLIPEQDTTNRLRGVPLEAKPSRLEDMHKSNA